MTLDFLAATSDRANVAANALSIPWASTTADDLVLLFAGIGGLSAFTDPTGFTAIDNLDESTTLRGKAWWHRCTGTEAGNVALTWGGTAQVGIAGMVAYRGAYAAGSPIDAHSVTGNTSAATSRATIATGASSNTDLQICAYLDQQAVAAQSWTPPSTFLERLDLSTTTTTFLGLEIVDSALLQAASNSGVVARTATSAQSGAGFVGWNIGLRVRVTAETDPISGPTYRAPSLRLGAVGWPAFGQGWPRIKQG